MGEKFNWMRKSVDECKGTTCEVLFGWGLDRGERNPTREALSSRIFNLINSIVEEKGLGLCLEWPVDVVLSDRDLVHPDIVFVGRDKCELVEGKEVKCSPTMIVEILENENDYIQLLLKVSLYEKYQVQEVWVVDPFKKEVNQYLYRETNKAKYLEYSGSHGIGDKFFSESLDSQINVDEIFGSENE